MTELEVGKEYWVKGEVMTRTNRGTYTVIKFANDEQRIWLEGPDLDGIQVVEAIPEREKVPQVAIEFYERYKDDNLDLGEWFSDFYSAEAIEDFPRLEELAEWLHDNDSETNRQREYALATLVTLGPSAVEVVEEPLGVLLVDMPKPSLWNYYYLASMWTEPNKEYHVNARLFVSDVLKDHHTIKITESEAKEKYPNFKWVSLEELENEG